MRHDGDRPPANAPYIHVALSAPTLLHAGPQQPSVPTFEAIRAAIPSDCFARSTRKGLLAFAFAASLYAAATMWLYSATAWYALVLACIVRGLTIGVVFIVGHDACHDALTPHTRLNRLIGQLAFLPSLHSFTGWRYGHNFVHHQHTQILEKDTGYPPLSPARYAASPRWQRAYYRLSRTPLGAGLLYFPLWWKYHAWPSAEARAAIRRAGPSFRTEQIILGLWLGLEVSLFAGIFSHLGVIPAAQFSPFTILFFGIIATQCVWLWQLGFVTFLHHFHPRVAWHSEASAPPAAQRQLESTTHMMFPGAAHWSMLNIFEHTAHHAVPQIPLYHLHRAQAALNRAFVRHIPRERLTLRNIGNAFTTCKLWDMEARKWVGYRAKGNG
jgi:acyl-lipid omega-6 desaturase (Delta-12 desaturase)